MDIYSFDLPEAARPQPVTYVKAIVKDAETGQVLSAKVDFIDVKSEQVQVSSITDAEGEFLICLPMGTDYALNVSKKNYLFYSENFEFNTLRIELDFDYFVRKILFSLFISGRSYIMRVDKVDKN